MCQVCVVPWKPLTSDPLCSLCPLGIYGVGDANADNSTNVPHAMWSGKRSAVSIHVKLETENAQYQISQAEAKELTKRELSERDVWDIVNPRDDALYVEDFDRL